MSGDFVNKSQSILPILRKGGVMQASGYEQQHSRSYKDYHKMFANANTKALLKELKTTLKEPALPYVKKLTLGKIEHKEANIRKAKLKKEIKGSK